MLHIFFVKLFYQDIFHTLTKTLKIGQTMLIKIITISFCFLITVNTYSEVKTFKTDKVEIIDGFIMPEITADTNDSMVCHYSKAAEHGGRIEFHQGVLSHTSYNSDGDDIFMGSRNKVSIRPGSESTAYYNIPDYILVSKGNEVGSVYLLSDETSNEELLTFKDINDKQYSVKLSSPYFNTMAIIFLCEVNGELFH